MIGSVKTFTDVSEIVRQQQEIDSLRRSCHLDKGFHIIAVAFQTSAKINTILAHQSHSQYTD